MTTAKSYAVRSEVTITVSLLIAVQLNLMSYPESLQSMIPNWILLVLIYWCLVAPHQVGVFAAWGTGLFVDILNLTILGQHALIFAAAAVLVSMTGHKVLSCPLWVQSIFVLGISILTMAFQFWINHLAFGYEFTALDWQSGIVAACMWPLVRYILNKVRDRQDSRAD